MNKRKITALIICILFVNILTGCNAYETVKDENYEYGHIKFPDGYFVISYMWDGNRKHMDIEIPESYNGKKITKIGGAIGRGQPAPFSIILPDEYTEIPNDDDKAFVGEGSDINVKDTEYETYSFTIHIGANVKEFDGNSVVYGGREEGDFTDIYYKIEYNYEIDDNNKYLQVIDGEVCKK